MPDHKPWWQDNPELEAIRQRVMDEIEAAEPLPPQTYEPDPILADFFSGASIRELSAAREDLERARERYDRAVLSGRRAGLTWGQMAQLLGVARQQLHRKYSRLRPETP